MRFIVAVTVLLALALSPAQADTTPPQILTMTPSDGSVLLTDLVDITTTVTDAGSGVNRVRYRILRLRDHKYWNGSTWVDQWSWNLATDQGNGEWHLPNVYMDLPAEHEVLAWTWDNDGNMANWHANPKHTVITTWGDDDPPIVTQVTPSGNTAAGFVDLSANVVDALGVGYVRFMVQRSDGQFWNGAAWSAQWSWVLATPGSGDVWEVLNVDATQPGIYKTYVWAWDSFLNLSNWYDNPSPIFSVADAAARPNFVVFLTDDQPVHTLQYMPILQEKLAARGVTFENAIATNPECCPYRASILSGGYHTHNTGVLRNTRINGQRINFNESKAMAKKLQDAGYFTCFVGRYMHGYQPWAVPVGWNRWVGNSYYTFGNYDYHRNVTFYDGQTTSVRDVDQYITDFHSDETINCIDEAGTDAPFFVWAGLYAPHTPYDPAPEDDGLFDGWISPRPVSADEIDLSDKPQFIQDLAALYANDVVYKENSEVIAPRKQREMLQSVDRMVGRVVDRLEELGELDNTVVVFVSDNGLTAGHHGIPQNKGLAYEASLRVPMVVSWPAGNGRVDDSLVASNLDIGATFFDLAGIPYGGDGDSLVPLLNNSQASWRDKMFIENYGFLEWQRGVYPSFDVSPIWGGCVTDRYKLILHSSGEREFYDLQTDPNEMESKHNDPAYATMMQQLEPCVWDNMGASIVEHRAPAGSVGVSYLFDPGVFGGQAPFTWSVDSPIPPGLSLDTSTGVISGLPAASGSWDFTLTLQGSRTRTYTGDSEVYRRPLTIDVY